MLGMGTIKGSLVSLVCVRGKGGRGTDYDVHEDGEGAAGEYEGAGVDAFSAWYEVAGCVDGVESGSRPRVSDGFALEDVDDGCAKCVEDVDHDYG
jgi:hypothetical protein